MTRVPEIPSDKALRDRLGGQETQEFGEYHGRGPPDREVLNGIVGYIHLASPDKPGLPLYPCGILQLLHGNFQYLPHFIRIRDKGMGLSLPSQKRRHHVMTVGNIQGSQLTDFGLRNGKACRFLLPLRAWQCATDPDHRVPGDLPARRPAHCAGHRIQGGTISGYVQPVLPEIQQQQDTCLAQRPVLRLGIVASGLGRHGLLGPGPWQGILHVLWPVCGPDGRDSAFVLSEATGNAV